MSFTTLPAKDPSETVTLSFLFGNELGTGETVSGCTVTCAVLTGTDPSPAAVLNGAPTVAATVLQSVTGGLDGVGYFLKATATTNLNRVLVRKALLAVSAN